MRLKTGRTVVPRYPTRTSFLTEKARKNMKEESGFTYEDSAIYAEGHSEARFARSKNVAGCVC